MTVSSEILSGFREMLERHGVPPTVDRIRTGTIIRAAIGARLGRIAILPRLLSSGGGADLPIVELTDLSGVVAGLLDAIEVADR